jgi:hypothetical protein
MMRVGRLLRDALTVLLGILLLTQPVAIAAEVLATVEGETITDREFLDFARNVERVQDLSGVPENARIGILENMLAIRRLAALGKKEGFDSDPDVVKNTEQAFRSVVIDAYRARYMASDAGIPESAAREYYDANPEKWTIPELITFRHLFINTTDLEKRIKDTDELKKAIAEKEKKVEDARAEIRAGKSFLEIAEKYSESGGQGKAEEKGKLIQAIRRRGALFADGRALLKSFQERLDVLQPGESSEPFRTPNGYEILCLESRRPAGRKTFDEARTDISRALLEGRNAKQVGRLEKEVLKGLSITRNYGLLSVETPDPDGVLIEILGPDPADTFRCTVRDYDERLMGMTIVARERMSRKDERENYLEEEVLKPECYWRVACKQGLDRDPGLIVSKGWLRDALIAAKVAKSEIDERVSKIQVSEEELRRYYEDPENSKQFASLAAARFRGFAVPAFATPREQPSAQHAVRGLCRKTAQDIIDKYNEGWEFGSIEALYGLGDRPPGAVPTPYQWGRPSDGKRHLGGLMVQVIHETVWLTARDLQMCGVHSTKDWATLTNLEPGKINPSPVNYMGNVAKIFPGENGYLVLESLERRDPEPRPYSECREEVRAALLKSRMVGIEREVYQDTLKTISYDLNKDVWTAIWSKE